MSQTMTFRPDAWSPQQAARIAGALYLITNVTAEFNLFYAHPRLFVAGDFGRTATNLVAHAQLFRVTIVVDLLTCVGVIMLNLALYELLVPVHRSLARLAAFWRLVEQSVYAGISVCNFVILSAVSGRADGLEMIEPRQLQALGRLLRVAKTSEFFVAMLFLCLGSGIYSYLLLRSRYIPRLLAISGIAACALGVVYILARFLFPAPVAAATASVLALPAVAKVLIALILVPIFSFELTLGFWLLVKGVRITEPEQSPSEATR